MKFTSKHTLTYILLAISISHLSYKLQQLQNNNNNGGVQMQNETKRIESIQIGLDFHPIYRYTLNEMNFEIYIYFIGFFIHSTVK